MPTSEAIRRLKDETNRFISNFIATEPDEAGEEKREQGKGAGQAKKKQRQGG